MSRFKEAAVMFMYLCIILSAIYEGNIIAVFLTGILWINYIKTVNTTSATVNLEKYLCKQLELFINSLRHDLRIPVIAQIRALQLMEKEKFGKLNANQKDMISQIEDSCKSTLNLLSMMINTYSMEKNNYKLIYEKFNLYEVIASCFDELSHIADEKQITLEFDSKIKNMYITADKAELKKVVINILINSISNACIGDEISVAANLNNKKIRFTFSCKKERRYNSFAAESNYTSVGQSIIKSFCRKIIETHNGKILENSSAGLFSFEIPEIAV